MSVDDAVDAGTPHAAPPARASQQPPPELLVEDDELLVEDDDASDDGYWQLEPSTGDDRWEDDPAADF
jgi:hypothetical protein